jgi:DUF1365 family protein
LRHLFGRPRNLLSFRSQDHGPRDGSPLLPWIENLLRERGLPADGEIVLQTFPRVFGYVFNPVSFWFCHDRSGALIAVLAEVNNTFGGATATCCTAGEPLRDGEEMRPTSCSTSRPSMKSKAATASASTCSAGQLARIDYDDAEGELLLTSISGKPRDWSAAALLGAFLRMPFLTLGVIARIHWQALKLWLKGVPFRGAHPATTLQESTK